MSIFVFLGVWSFKRSQGILNKKEQTRSLNIKVNCNYKSHQSPNL